MAFGFIGISLIRLVGEYLFTQRTKDDQRIADALAEQFGAPLAAFDASGMYAAAEDAALAEQGRVLVLDPLCVVQVDSASAMNGSRFITAEIRNVLDGAASDYGYYDTGGTDRYWLRAMLGVFTNVRAMTGVYANAIYGANGALSGVLVYISQVQEIYENLRTIQLRILAWLVVVTLAVLVINAFILRTITRPIGALNQGIARMAEGDLSTTVEVRGNNEFADLAKAFNSMADRLKQLDESRSLFVSNASHELKTPLSTMKILIETLLYQDPLDPEMTKDFLKDANSEIDRLNRIISDLLTLVKMDDGMTLNPVELDISNLVQEQARRLAPLARENGIELECSFKEPLTVNGDQIKLQQVIYNVIDNAIKYTGRGGEVNCTIARSGRNAVIKIADTGIGIPPEHLPHIFERFYRVDKARSRETGGTGLGLSIVKQTITLHNGRITADSTPGKGTTFTIELPLAAKN